MRTIIFLCFSIFSLSGCFGLFKTPTNEGAKLTISELSSAYILNLISADYEALGTNLFTTVYLANQNLSEDEYTKRVSQLKNKWTVEIHPLAHLSIVDATVKNNRGFVSLQRLDSKKDFPKVTIQYEWTGNSWSIVDDNILGKNDLFETYNK